MHEYEFCCEYVGCERGFDTYVGLRAHQVSSHRMHNPIRYKLNTSKCESCLKEFHTISRAFKHVAYGDPKCKAFYMARDSVLDQSQLEKLLASEIASKKAHGVKTIAPPAFQTF